MAQAQDTQSRWGIGVSFTPQWKGQDKLMDLFLDLQGEETLEGQEFTVGIVRGSMRGGDWGVSYVHKPFKDGSTFVDFDEECPCTITRVLHDVAERGVEFHWSRPFVTFAERVQVGMNVAGGIAWVDGTVDQTTTFPPPTTPNTPVIPPISLTGPANEILYSYLALFKLEAEGAVLAAPGLKIKFSGGLNNPGFGFRIGAVYLFGGQ